MMSRVRASVIVVSVVVGFVGVAPAAQAASKGSIAVTVAAPRGVATSVKITSGKRVLVAAKPLAGKSRTTKLSAASGTWRPDLTVVSTDGRLFKPVSKPSKVKVTSKRTSKLLVTFKEVRVARDLNVGVVREQSASFTYTRSSVRNAATRLRIAPGSKAPTSYKSGSPAAIVSPGRGKANGLKIGTTYTVGLFTKIGKTWYGPVARTFSTKARPSETKTTAEFIVAEDTVLLTSADRFEATPVREVVQPAPEALGRGGSWRSAAPPATLSVPTVDLRLVGQTARINQTYVVPPTNSLPGGFIGSVVSVSASGVAKLHQAPVSDAVDKADIKVPKIDVPAKTLTPKQETAGSKCALGADAAWDIEPPTVTIEGSGDFKLDSSGFTIESKVVATLDASVGAHVDAAVICDFNLPTIRRSFAAGPIPMALEFKPTLKATAEGAVKITGFGFQAKAGYSSRVKLPLPGHGEVSVDTKPLQGFEWKTPSATAAGDLYFKASGTLDVGPGVASDVAGLTAGITGTFTPLDAHAGITYDADNGACITASASGSASLGVKAKAWVNLVVWKYEASAQHDIFNTSWDYGRQQSWPAECTPAAAIKTASLPDGTVGTPYNARLETTDNRSGHWSIVDGSLPAGLTLDGDTIHGNPTAAGTSSFAVAFDDGDSHAERSMSIEIRGSLAFATTLVSAASDGTHADDNSGSPSISQDGRFVAFASSADNLVAGDTNGVSDIFVSDRITGAITRISESTEGAQSNAPSSVGAISADGRYVTFSSSASTLVPGDQNGLEDLFVFDRDAGTTAMVSRTPGGNEPDGASYGGAISADGRYVTYTSEADDLTTDDFNGRSDVFVTDRTDGVTRLISRSSDGMQGNDRSVGPSISADGRSIAYGSTASNLIAGDTNGTEDVFVTNRVSGVTVRVSMLADGTQGNNHSFGPSLSADGRYVSYESFATNFTPHDTNFQGDIFVNDRATGATTLVSRTPDGDPGNVGGNGAILSADGRYIAFNSQSSNLASGDTDGFADEYVADRLTGVTTLVSTSTAGSKGNGHSFGFAFSADGRYIAYESQASNLVEGDSNQKQDVFLTRWRQ